MFIKKKSHNLTQKSIQKAMSNFKPTLIKKVVKKTAVEPVIHEVKTETISEVKTEVTNEVDKTKKVKKI